VPSPDATPRIAFAIGRRVGPAVARNRLRRQLRAIFAEANPAPGAYLVSVTPASTGARQSLPTAELREMVTSALASLDAAEISPKAAVGL
jgi:ribonuclease P protein component